MVPANPSDVSVSGARRLRQHPADRVVFLRSVLALPILLYPAIAELPGGVAGVVTGLVVGITRQKTQES